MILIADGGSTKTSWIAVDENYNKLFDVVTKGLNPAVFEEEVIINRLIECNEIYYERTKVKKIFFYGAGCGTEKPKQNLRKVFEELFKNAEITIEEDTVAAIYAVTTDPAIVCILGTGSNCTLFDGKNVIQKIDSLGYSIMDDASGNHFGRILLRDYYFHKMPEGLAKKFASEYDLNADTIKMNLYKKENPNTYLAGFCKFLIENKNTVYSQKVLKTGLKTFIENQILQFEEAKTLPVHFIGSIAHFLEDEIKEIFSEYGLNFGRIQRHPIIGLVDYHRNN